MLTLLLYGGCMSEIIKDLYLNINSELKRLEFGNSTFVQLIGDKVTKDTLLFNIERFLAMDFSDYYNNIDNSIGVVYHKLDGDATINFIDGLIHYKNGVLRSWGSIPNIHCIRYSSGNTIRSFSITDSSFDTAGIDMTKYSHLVSNSAWMRIEKLVNELVGYKFVNIDTSNKIISFDFDSNSTEWTSDEIKMVYLLLSESTLTPVGYKRVTLLSELNMSNEKFIKLINSLSKVSNNELVIYSNNCNIELINYCKVEKLKV